MRQRALSPGTAFLIYVVSVFVLFFVLHGACQAEADVDWYLPVVTWQTSASDYLRGVRLQEEAELSGRLWEATPLPLRWTLPTTVLQELEGAPPAERASTQPPRGGGKTGGKARARGGSRGAGGGAASSSAGAGASWQPRTWTTSEAGRGGSWWRGGGWGWPRRW
jgi:hypothetical protein